MIKLNNTDRYKFRLSNGDWIEDILENHLDLLKINGLDILGCIVSKRLSKLSN